MASRTQGVAVTKDTSILSLTEELKTGALTINAPADAEVAICEQMADGQIAAYKADSTAAQERDRRFCFPCGNDQQNVLPCQRSFLCHI